MTICQSLYSTEQGHKFTRTRVNQECSNKYTIYLYEVFDIYMGHMLCYMNL